MRRIVTLDYLYRTGSMYKKIKYIRRLFFDSSPIIRKLFFHLLQTALNMISNIPSNSKVLDVGISEGPFQPTLSKYFDRIVGSDILLESLSIGKAISKCQNHELHNAEYVLCDGTFLPFKSSSYNVVFCLETLEHMSDVSVALSEFSRILKRNGNLVISIPIEIGLPLFIRQLAGKILGFYRNKYSIWELLDAILVKNLNKRREQETLLYSPSEPNE